MKKIPTLFVREFENHRVVKCTEQVTPGMEWVLAPECGGIATLKLDGACCAVRNGELYKRYDAKHGKTPPEGAIPCSDPDPVTGHWPHWVKCDPDNPADKWFFAAYENRFAVEDGTYEAVGPHFQGNPYRIDRDILLRHGGCEIALERSFSGIYQWLLDNSYAEGIVFWKDGEPQCKIKRSDFALPWPPVWEVESA